jgi:hypothetical protein
MISDLNIIVNQKKIIIEACIRYMKENYPTRTVEYYKCQRDLGYILDAFIHDVSNNTTSNTIYIGNKFWIRNVRQITTYQVEVSVYNYMIQFLKETLLISNDTISTIDSLKNIIVNIIKNGAIEEPNTWRKNASLRINTYNWTNEVPSKDVISSVLHDLHDYSPSKQKGVRYHIDVYRNDNEDNCNKIYRAHAADTTDTARHNPQVLAPWLLFFRTRDDALTKSDYRVEDFYMDLGIATSNIIYSASANGLDTGMSRCINYPELIKDVIGYVPQLSIGIGYRNNEQTYLCPYYNKLVPIPGGDAKPKPDIEEYINYV